MSIQNIGGDPDPSICEASLAPTEDLGTLVDGEFEDVQSGPGPSLHTAHHGTADGEEGEEDDIPPKSSQPRRSQRILELSQPPVEDDGPVNLISDDEDQGIDADGKDADLPPTQDLPPPLPLRQSSVYKPSAELKLQMEWEVKPVGRAIPASATPFGHRPGASQLTFYRSISVLRDQSDPEYLDDGTARVTHSVGDTILIGWERNDPKEEQSGKDQAVCRIMALFVDKRDGIARFVPQWGRSWSDIVNPYSDEDAIEPDDALRASKEIFWESETGSWSVNERGLDPGELNEVYNISRPAYIRHNDDFRTEEELNAFIAEPDCYFYRYSLPHAGPLRFEELPCPKNSIGETAPTEKKRVSAPLRMVDAFCGSGAVSVAATEVGWTVSIGIESNSTAFKTYVRNAPQAAERTNRNYKIQDFLRLVKQGTDLQIPRKGQVEWLHLSPPCQSLCSQNAHKGVDRYTAELIPLLHCIRELIMELEPIFITIEEVPRFIFAEMPKYQFTKRKKANAVSAAATAAGPSAAPLADDGPNEDEELEVDIDNPEAAEADLNSNPKERMAVRAWLHIVPDLLTSNWQVDMRVLNSAHYGCPQERPRLFLFAARRGYELPYPPAPKYHSVLRYVGFKKDPILATIKHWDCMTVQSDPNLPLAVTALEAIDDLPRLKKKKEAGADEGSLSQQDPRGLGDVLSYDPRNPNCISRYVKYMRHGAPFHIVDHQRLRRTCGNVVNHNMPFGTIIGQDDKWSKSIHYAEHRALTVQERRRGQSFPDRMELAGTAADNMKIVGNAVPFLLARAVAASVMIAATGNPSSAPPLPNLKGWVDEEGNEVEGPVLDFQTSPDVRKAAAQKRKRRRGYSANGDSSAEEEEDLEDEDLEDDKIKEEKKHDGELDETLDDEVISNNEEEEREFDEDEQGTERRIKKKKTIPRRKRPRPISPENCVEVNVPSYAGRKFHTPMKMQRIDTFFSSPGPTREASVDPEIGGADADMLESGQQPQRQPQMLQIEEQWPPPSGAALEDGGGGEQEAPEESTDVTIKDEPAVPAAMYYQESDIESSGQSSAGVAEIVAGPGNSGVGDVGGASGSGQGLEKKKSSLLPPPAATEVDVIDLTMDTDDE